MAGTFQYPVYFECPTMDEELQKKIQNHFNIRRKSGGGDCGPVTRINDKVWSIAFKDGDAQQRVLQRPTHEVKVANGSVVLNVQGNLGPTSQSGSPEQDTASPQLQSQQSIPASSLPAHCEEYDLRPDSYLLRYLNECPKALEEVGEVLKSMACSVKLNVTDEVVLVKRLVPPGDADEDRNWKAKVDQLFENYLCHYELDPHKIKALLQSSTSGLTTTEVKVYSEVGMVVVVGKVSQVRAWVLGVENVHGKRKSCLRDKQTRRLGEAKLRLLWKEIESSLGQVFPGVKVTRADAGQVVVEGPVEEILEAGDWISQKENLVLERKVPNMSPFLLSFLRNAYEGPKKLGDSLGFGDTVEVELRDTELCLFARSASKLDDTENKLLDAFKELKISIPNCLTVPQDLREILLCKTNEMNQNRKNTVQTVFAAENTLYLLGHTKEVEDLNEIVAQFILDHTKVEGALGLRFPELVNHLPEFLELHNLNYSGVVFHSIPESLGPTVRLEGSSNKVTEVRNRLGPFLDSLVKRRVTIDLPGATRYFLSPSGRESIVTVAHSHKCLIQLQEKVYATDPNLRSGERLSGGSTTKYCLNNGLEVLVCQGDITKQDTDALVNAANEDLDHCGGVAAALSKAGGPQIQKESTAIVKQTGKIRTGDVVETSGGNLKCKILLHAVGPVQGKSGGKERELLKKTIQSALKLAEDMELASIAMPCISSGVYGVPVTVCSDVIVATVKEFSSGAKSLKRIILIDNRGEVVRAMLGACDRLLQGITTGNTTSGSGFHMGGGAHADIEGTATGSGPGVHVEIIQGIIETQQVDALICPMVNNDPLSTRVGHALHSVTASAITNKFRREAGAAMLPGDMVLVEGLPTLTCRGVFFLNLVPYDSNQHGTTIQVLRLGIRKILAACAIKGFRSLALPVLGTGAVLRFPHSVASKAILEEVKAFEQDRVSGTSLLIRIVIHPSDKDSCKAFQSAQDTLHLRGFTNDANPDQASFYRHVSVFDDQVTAMLGGVKLQMVHGDIIHERTDVIINTTDFSNSHSGVSKAILTAAGPTVQAELANVGLPNDRMCTTGPGRLQCKEIIHATFMGDPQVIRQHCKKIVSRCEKKGHHSAAFPAINTGAAGVDSAKACTAMLDGITAAITDLKPKSLSLIRIVILQQPVFQSFRSVLENRFGQTAKRHLKLREKAKQILKKFQDKVSRTSSTSLPPDQIISFNPEPAVISVIGVNPDTMNVKRALEDSLQKQLIERCEDAHSFSKLDAMELEALQAKVRLLEISLECRRDQDHRARNTARGQSGSGDDFYVLRGLREDVLSVTELLHSAIQKALYIDLQEKQEAVMALNVQWSIKDTNDIWQELSLHDNYLLEDAHLHGQVFVDVTGPDDTKVSVNMRARQAVNQVTGLVYEVQRCESRAVLELPQNWEPMGDELFKKIELNPNSSEYKRVAQGFHKTAQNNIVKIERVQNYYLWHAYSLRKQEIRDKNGPAHVGEMSLYHGTSAKACNCIERDKFDRGHAGEHAALYGKGVYFAVNANYSVRYSPADAAGLRRMYAASVLTGHYTVGNASMKAAPPRGSDPTDRFDSVVNNQQSPSMFVIFQDAQAYPEYCITFM
ncbi:uncharacterized protein V6R79_006267 [Siganus canaliculatus]